MRQRAVWLAVAVAAVAFGSSAAAATTGSQVMQAGNTLNVHCNGPSLTSTKTATRDARLVCKSPSPTPSPSSSVTPPPPTGGVWSSGAATENPDGFAAWRGAPLDNATTWPARSNWSELSHPDVYGQVSSAKTPKLSIGMVMFPQGTYPWAACAAGSFDGYYRTYGSELVRIGRPSALIRLFWEFNLDSNVDGHAADFNTCWRRIHDQIRSTDPRALFMWNPNKDNHLAGSVTAYYPGDAYVDVVGPDFYNQWPAYPDQSAWDADYLSTQNGGPRGIGSWLNFATSHGKLFAVPEWGTSLSGGGADQPYFIQAMHDFFASNAAVMWGETYFNLRAGSEGFLLWPSTINANSAAKYRALF